ncbi:uncharacterized protein CCOS01_03188 [Colletotrichum costaricense]|uniref:Uncharacterized protein n=2 Tax=Colletotrichum acutatum species complex TaxID=2707335 RepID=A0AAI9Z653_9PEZI|nr:uncharacterized protein CCOS01_03188 [Colletotrichum costaricense]KAK1534436.1 hypothetical protein CCOS01_03188 [Colletotrichum costaricense]
MMGKIDTGGRCVRSSGGGRGGCWGDLSGLCFYAMFPGLCVYAACFLLRWRNTADTDIAASPQMSLLASCSATCRVQSNAVEIWLSARHAIRGRDVGTLRRFEVEECWKGAWSGLGWCIVWGWVCVRGGWAGCAVFLRRRSGSKEGNCKQVDGATSHFLPG